MRMTDSSKIHVLDVRFLEESEVIACYLIESEQGPILVETGPETTFENLKSAVAQKGFNWRDIEHVPLTHIHFDHAGAAWKFAENGADIYVHPKGLPHLNNPERLWNSAKRIYQDDMEMLWGKMKPIAQSRLIPLENGQELNIGEHSFKVHYAPGHAVHHNAYQLEEALFTGDVAGVKICGGPVVPPCPPPDIHIEAWKESIHKLRTLDVETLYIAHFGRVESPQQHFSDLEMMLNDWAHWMKPYYEGQSDPKAIIPQFRTYTHDQLKALGASEGVAVKYEKANPSYMSVTGLLRYWKLKEQGRI